MSRIPDINNNPSWSRVIRYEASTAVGDETFYAKDLLSCIVSSENGTTSSTTVVSAIKIRGIKLTLLGDGTGVSQVGLTWESDRSSDVKKGIFATATGVTTKMFPPPKNSFPAMWLDVDIVTGSESVFKVDTTDLAGCLLMDLHVDIKVGPGTAGPTVSSSEDGVYFPALPLATGTFVPPFVRST